MNQDFARIERYLYQYNNYLVGLKNMKRYYESLYPRVTATYDDVGGGSTGAFTYKSQTEDIALKRMEKEFENLKAQIDEYELIIGSIDEALKHLDKTKRKFVELRYFQRVDMDMIASKLKYANKRSVYSIRDKVEDELIVSLKILLSMSS
ncbi:hypothetical protein [Halobacillus sp. H74]|uniref:hypothetical protein n=1 Tax=Halobacillus sp. H74 TaxID=3457436 RepID=UPI003FCD16EC